MSPKDPPPPDGEPEGDSPWSGKLWTPTQDDLAAMVRETLTSWLRIPVRVEPSKTSPQGPGFSCGLRVEGILQGFLEVHGHHSFADWLAEHVGETVKPVDAYHDFVLKICEKLVAALKKNNHPDFVFHSLEHKDLERIRPGREPDVRTRLAVFDRGLELRLWLKPAFR